MSFKLMKRRVGYVGLMNIIFLGGSGVFASMGRICII